MGIFTKKKDGNKQKPSSNNDSSKRKQQYNTAPNHYQNSQWTHEYSHSGNSDNNYSQVKYYEHNGVYHESQQVSNYRNQQQPKKGQVFVSNSINRQATDFSDQQTASSSVYMTTSQIIRGRNNNMKVDETNKFEVGKLIVPSPDDVAVMQKDVGMMVVNAGGFGIGKDEKRRHSLKLEKNEEWQNAVKKHHTSNGFHGRPPEGIIAQHPNSRARSDEKKDSEQEALVANDKQMDEVVAKLEKLVAKTENVTTKQVPAPVPKPIRAVSPKDATPRQLALMSGADIKAPGKKKSNTIRAKSISHNQHERFMRRRSSGMSAISSLSSMDSLPDLHEDLASASWKSFHQNLTTLATKPELVLPALTAIGPDECTPLHTAVWKVRFV